MPSLQSEPVVVQGVIAILAAAFTPILLKFGIDAGGAATIFSSIGALATAALSAWSLSHARSKVTPVATPAPTPPPAK